ncbi:hypothetical protein, conserved [Trypanosoma brucei brucei TREU927]|uniref:Uncharacterized protein n=1 Tax=Trypanosoma brucei brucei (strain 927/4 GUTat10.1) TaxID=185431 RepID=Q57WU9_TRYB2|nr:hypothetical protein, conserved [Trypanosoma brucei brucei TREU927]AAX69918.1 hypothetical protein, conserved [Trypanosoma brucei]AAZ10103.1 hypothetical protein, conserved [Trypanosoma brucei brucei TREU927]
MNEAVVSVGGVRKVLNTLQRKHQWLINDARLFYIGGQWHGTVQSLIVEHLSRCRELKRPLVQHEHVGNVLHPLRLEDEYSRKERFLQSLFDEADFNVSADPLFYLFSGSCCNIGVQEPVGNNFSKACELPLTVNEAAAHVRRHTAHQSMSDRFPSSVEPHLLEGGLSDKSAVVCTPVVFLRELFHSCAADVVALDFSGPHEMGMFPQNSVSTVSVLQDVRDAMTLSSYLLKPSGALLLRFPLCMVSREKGSFLRLMKCLTWGFQVSRRCVDGEYIYCLGCRKVAEYPAAVEHRLRPSRRAGGAEKGTGRRNFRNNVKRSYFAALMPSFTNAAFVKEPMEGSAPRDSGPARNAKMDEEAFFAVSVEMMEKGLYNHKPDE